MTLQPQKPKPRRLSSCHRHPSEPVTGFCALCLRERLAGLDSPSSSSAAAAAAESIILTTNAASSSLQPELRRCKSYAAGKGRASSAALEPRRKSCDDRARNTLWHLFSLDDEEKHLNRGSDVESKNLGFSKVADVENPRVSEDAFGQNVNDEEQKEEVEEVVEEETKTMKEHIELEWQSRKHKGNVGGSLLSVFSQKLRKWRLKQRSKNRRGGGDLLPAEKINRRQVRETQSEVGDYGFGRRSCDTDPRFSVDANRISLDDHPRLSFDHDPPRASWDGYMIARTIPRLAPMLSVIENAMIPPSIRCEEQMNSIHENEASCSDSSSSRRRNSFDCSSSGKSSNKKVGVEVDELKSMNEMKSMKFVVTDREMESSESVCKNTDSIVGGGGDSNGFRKSGKWQKGWSILGFMHRLGDTKDGKVEGNGNGHTLGDCGEKQNGDVTGEVIYGDSREKLMRSGSCVSSRSGNVIGGSYHRSSSVAENRDYANKKVREESNRSAMYSPSNLDNGLLRFHLTPSWSGRRKSGSSRLKNSQSIARSVFRLN